MARDVRKFYGFYLYAIGKERLVPNVIQILFIVIDVMGYSL